MHVVGSTTVLIPQRVVVVFSDGTELITLDKPRPSEGQREPLVCSYTDPAGLLVTIAGSVT
jgi:hypothetical protein